MYDSLLSNVLAGIATVLGIVGAVILMRTPDRNMQERTGHTARRLVWAFVLLETACGIGIAATWIDGTSIVIGHAIATVLYLSLLLWLIPKMRGIVRAADEHEMAERSTGQ